LKKFTVLKQFTFGTTKDTHRLHKHGEVIETNFPPKIEADLVKGGFITPYREPEPEPEDPKKSFQETGHKDD